MNTRELQRTESWSLQLAGRKLNANMKRSTLQIR